MPEEAKKEFIEALGRVIENPDFKRDAAARAMVIDFKAGDEYARFLKNQEEEFRKIWQEIKGQIEKK